MNGESLALNSTDETTVSGKQRNSSPLKQTNKQTYLQNIPESKSKSPIKADRRKSEKENFTDS